MRNKYLVFTLCLSALVFTRMNGQEMRLRSCQKLQAEKMLSKGIPFFKASDTTEIPLIGSLSSNYFPLTFSFYKHLHGSGIKAKKNGYTFALKKGSYQIAFTGTFQAVNGGISLIDLALQLGSKIIAPNTNKIERGFDNFQILTICQIVHIEKDANLSIVARNRADSTITNVLQRSISIIKLD